MILLLKTARAEGKPPTLFIGAPGMFARSVPAWIGDEMDSEPMDQTEYTPLDLALCAGYQYYLDSLCNKCGTPLWYGRSEHSSIEFHVEHSTCYSCAELETYREKSREKSRDSRPGESTYTVMDTVEYSDGTKESMPSPLEALEFVK